MSVELTVIVPATGTPEQLERCIKALRMNTTCYNAIIVTKDNEVETCRMADTLLNDSIRRLNVSYMATYEDMCDLGVSMADGQNIAVLDSRSVPGIKWSRVMLNELKCSSVGITSPSVRISFDTAHVSPKCFMVRRDVLNEMGGTVRGNLAECIFKAGYTVMQSTAKVTNTGFDSVEAPKKIEEPVIQTYSEIPVQEVFLEEVAHTFPGRVEQAVSTPVKKKKRRRSFKIIS